MKSGETISLRLDTRYASLREWLVSRGWLPMRRADDIRPGLFAKGDVIVSVETMHLGRVEIWLEISVVNMPNGDTLAVLHKSLNESQLTRILNLFANNEN